MYYVVSEWYANTIVTNQPNNDLHKIIDILFISLIDILLQIDILIVIDILILIDIPKLSSWSGFGKSFILNR
jgi:hypothetical protein